MAADEKNKANKYYKYANYELGIVYDEEVIHLKLSQQKEKIVECFKKAATAFIDKDAVIDLNDKEVNWINEPCWGIAAEAKAKIKEIINSDVFKKKKVIGGKKTRKNKKTKKRRKTRKNKKTKKRRMTKKKARRRRTKKNQKGGDLKNAYRLTKLIKEHFEPLKISYKNRLINPEEDLTGQKNLYNEAPKILFNPHPEKTYFITMTDPDAKATWTHYVIMQNNNEVIEESYKYQPPTPPPNSGPHRYIFNAYLYRDEKLMNNHSYSGDVYYKKILEPIIKQKDVVASFQYTVRSN